MYLQKNTTICSLYAISPVHAGSGQATGAVDLPIQRERHTNWPHVQASGVKGAFRDHCRQFWMHENPEQATELTARIFGQAEEGGGSGGQAGAIAFSDARLLLFPVRSSVAPFVWVTCPAVLGRFARDLALTGQDEVGLDSLAVQGDDYLALRGEINDKVVLEDLVVNPKDGEVLGVEILEKFAPAASRLLLVSDQIFTFLVQTATEIQTQIKIDEKTGTAQAGALRYEELLPADSLFYTLVFFGDERADVEKSYQLDMIRSAVQKAVSNHIQLGGDMTLGRGIFETCWVSANQEG